jgi:hypothetical protein
VASAIAPPRRKAASVASNSRQPSNTGGKPVRGIACKTISRVDAKPVSSPSQNGLELDSASRSGRSPSSASMIASALSAPPTATCTCIP